MGQLLRGEIRGRVLLADDPRGCRTAADWSATSPRTSGAADARARYGYGTVIAATPDLRRTLVFSVGSTDAKGESMNAVAQRIVLAALARRR